MKMLDEQSRINELETAAYIGDMAASLAQLAHRCCLTDLAYLLALVQMEAERIGGTTTGQKPACAEKPRGALTH
jgi:hypothetical protein